ncbi:MAG: hypothetical protein ACODAQ_03345 [Phycisphaeraceae bacterium]
MTTAGADTGTLSHLQRRGPAWTLWVGLSLIAVCEAMLFVDVARRGGLVVPYDALAGDLPEPRGALGHAARWFAMNITALCWIGYLLLFDGLLTWLARRRGQPALSPLRARPNRFVVIWLTSIPIWCVFDAINFYLMDAWRYHGLPDVRAQRFAGYFIAFAAILPGMFLAAHLFQMLGLRRLRSSAAPQRVMWVLVAGPASVIVACALVLLAVNVEGEMASPLGVLASAVLLIGPATVAAARTRCPRATAFAIGCSFLAWTLLAHDPIANMTLWVGLWLLLDPINAAQGAPSLIEDWSRGRYGRTLALFAGGALCGLLWEFWNYWAIAKWTYDLPFLGALQQVSYFEMPLPGFLGFLPFAAECWVMMNTVMLVLRRVGLRVAEPLPDEDAVV